MDALEDDMSSSAWSTDNVKNCSVVLDESWEDRSRDEEAFWDLFWIETDLTGDDSGEPIGEHNCY